MQWYEEEKKSKQNSKISRLLIMGMVITVIIILALIFLIMYLYSNANKKIAIVNGVQNNQIYNLLEINSQNDNTEIMIPIKEFALALGYEAYNGSYKNVSEDKNKCYVIVEEEVANFELESNIITKLDLTTEDSEYEYNQISDKVIQKNGILYTTIEGIEKGLNLSFIFNKQKQQVDIRTLDWLADYYEESIEQGVYKGYTSLDTESLKNKKAILDNMLVVVSDNEKYGVISSRKRRNNFRSKI